MPIAIKRCWIVFKMNIKEFLTKLQQANPDEKGELFEALLGTDGFDAEEFLNKDLETIYKATN